MSKLIATIIFLVLAVLMFIFAFAQVSYGEPKRTPGWQWLGFAFTVIAYLINIIP